MHLLRSLFVVSSLAGALAARHDPVVVQRRASAVESQLSKNQTDVESRRFIVEFNGDADSQAEAEGLASRLNVKVVKVFESDVFRGACVEADLDNLDILKAEVPVSQAWHAKRVVLAPVLYNETFGPGAAGVNMSIHHMTGVDKLHEAGIRGKGVTVAVVDTGVQYTHPALGGGIGEGYKIAGGYDLVGDGTWPDDPERTPDSDPMDHIGHGTHVSGIIAGESSLFTGVAPDATLRVYKVFSAIDSTSEEILIEAFLMAYNDGADVITSSIGGLDGWSDNAWAVVASRLVDQGVVVTISAGNDGETGPFSASSGSSGANVLAIASVDADITPGPSLSATFYHNTTETNVSIPYMSYATWNPMNITNWPVVALSLDTTIEDDACSPLPNNTGSLANKFVLIRRGGCDFSVKQTNVGAFGANVALIYTNEEPLVKPDSTDYHGSVAIGMITREAGAEIIRTIKAGGEVTIDLTTTYEESLTGVPNEATGGTASYFTSIGATNDLFIKPDIAAPGGNILSAYPTDGYAVLSGTSMACPYVAGIAALYIGQFGGRQVHGPGFGKQLAARILSSGSPIPWNAGTGDVYDYGIPASVAQVGAGLVNATKVLSYDTALSLTRFALNDTQHFGAAQTVQITNNGAEAVTYTFSTQEFGGVLAVNTNASAYGAPRIAYGEEALAEPLRGAVPAVALPEPLTVQPGETVDATVTFTALDAASLGVDPVQLPLYGGTVVITGSNGESLVVPYQGLAADLEHDAGTIFDYVTGYPQLTSTPDDVSIADKANFTFDLSADALDYPNFYTRLRYASRELRWDLFDAAWNETDWAYPPVVGQNGFVGAATSWRNAASNFVFNATQDNATDVVPLPMTNLPRSPVTYYGVELWWLGRLANGSQIAPGTYNMRIAALLPFADPKQSDSWDVYQTPAITVLPLE